MKMIINRKELTMVTPASPTRQVGLWNSNLDLVVPMLHVQVVYFYRPDGSTNFFDPGVIKEALGKALVPFYPVAGRLRRDEDGRIEINCNGEGVLFVEADADARVDDLGDFAPTMEFQQLIPAVDYSGDISSFPLLVLQVTRFRCGGVSLGIGMHHFVADGFSSFHFINSWSVLARGLDIVIPPFIDRSLLRARDPPRPTFPHIEYQPPTDTDGNVDHSHGENNTKPPQTAMAMLKITSAQLGMLQAKSGRRLSSFSLLIGHVWRCFIKARDLSDVNQETKLHIATDGRGRLKRNLPIGYFGNVIFPTTVNAKVDELINNDATFGAGKIQDALARMDDEYLRSALDHLELQPDLLKLTPLSHIFRSTSLVITNWTSLPTYDADFGWGRPIFVGPGWLPLDGMAIPLANPTDDGSRLVAIFLQQEHMKKFCKLFYDKLKKCNL